MKKKFIVLFLSLTLLFNGCGNTATSKKSSELSGKYDFYQESVKNIQKNMDVDPDQADEIFLTLIDCGVSELINYVIKNNDNTFSVWSSGKEYSVTLSDGVVSTVFTNDFLKEVQLYPAPENETTSDAVVSSDTEQAEKEKAEKEKAEKKQAEKEQAEKEKAKKEKEEKKKGRKRKAKNVRAAFDLLLENPDYEGGIVSIEPRTIDGKVFSWSIIDVVVPDSWYYIEEYQKERYCTNVGDYIKSALVSCGIAENEGGCSVYFFDVAGVEVAKSKMLGGYKIKK